jgi:hypothetical protein
MSPPDNEDRKADSKSRLVKRLHDPVQLRTFVTIVVVLVGYLGVYTPLNNEISEASRKLREEERRLDLARNLEHLRGQFRNLQSHLTQQTDSKEWVNYVLGGVRQFPLKLVALDCDAPRDLGPYKAVVLRIELEGSFPDMDAFLCWLESNQRLFRADSVRIVPSRSAKDVLILQLTVLGVMG